MAFATIDEVADQWRTLTNRETERGTGLLDLAEQLIRSKVDIAPTDTVKLAAAKQLSIELVTDALDNGPRRSAPAVTQASLDGGAYTVALPDGDGRAWLLVWTDAMYALFGVSNGEQQPAYYFGDEPQ